MIISSSLHSEIVDDRTTETYCRVPYRVSFVYASTASFRRSLMHVDRSCDETPVVESGADGRYPDWRPLRKAITGCCLLIEHSQIVVHILKHAKIVVCPIPNENVR